MLNLYQAVLRVGRNRRRLQDAGRWMQVWVGLVEMVDASLWGPWWGVEGYDVLRLKAGQ